ncbi:MAG: DUF1801 domain-containing protein [Saprospiraceae bacterium]
MKHFKFQTIQQYIELAPNESKKALIEIRNIISKAVPDTIECISYNIPCFKLNKKSIFFAGYKNHVSVYPAPSNAEEFKEELSTYKGGKGTVQFPLNEELPVKLIARIAKFIFKI